MMAAYAAAAFSAMPSVGELLARLDSMIDNEDTYVRQKLDKIAQIKQMRKRTSSEEERYWNNRSLYDEYFVFDADSAMRYADSNLKIACNLGNRQWEYEWRINKSFALSVMGFLNEAQEELSQIDINELSDSNKIKYYGQLAYLYSHMGQLGRNLRRHRSARHDPASRLQEHRRHPRQHRMGILHSAQIHIRLV